jgi:hypothetical protein
MARKAGPPRGATQPGQRPMVGQDPATELPPIDAAEPSSTDAVTGDPVTGDGDRDDAFVSPVAMEAGASDGDARPETDLGQPSAQNFGVPRVSERSEPLIVSSTPEAHGDSTLSSSSEPLLAGDDPTVSSERVDRPSEDSAGTSQPADPEVATPLYEYPSTPPVVQDPPRRGGIGSLLLGGMIAAALGFGAAYLAQDRLGPPTALLPGDLEARLAALEERPVPDAAQGEALAARLSEVETRLTALEEAPEPAAEAVAQTESQGGDQPAQGVDLEPLREEIALAASGAESQVAALEERVAALEARPAVPQAAPTVPLAGDPGPAVRAEPVDDVPEATPEVDVLAVIEPRLAQAEAGLSEVRAEVAENREAIQALDAGVAEVRTNLGAFDTRLGEAEAASASAQEASASAEERARAAEAALTETEARTVAAETQARAGAALAQLDSALDDGAPFEGAVAELQTAGVEVPEPLALSATTGVPSLATLRETFPDAARAGLAEARAQGLLEDGSGVFGFLSNQLSLRSTAPRAGTDIDAVLSRAESALVRGRLDEALVEVDTLPQPVRDAMGDWIPQARTRAEAVAALSALRGAEPDAVPAD